MPRTARASLGNHVYHVLNRGNEQRRVFHKPDDYAAFLNLVSEACQKSDAGVRVLAACLMPNHFHLVLWPVGDGDLSRWMAWLMTAHVRRYRAHHGGSGHVWQGRFKAFAVEEDAHLYDVLRYVERNALRAGLCERARDWPWGTLGMRLRRDRPSWLSAWPVGEPADWEQMVDRPQTEAELAALRLSVERERPYGSAAWGREAAERLGMTHTLRARGRPRTEKKGTS